MKATRTSYESHELGWLSLICHWPRVRAQTDYGIRIWLNIVSTKNQPYGRAYELNESHLLCYCGNRSWGMSGEKGV
ncbi:hypothetical protein HYDPIDRAFT_105989 [Hydnomerulius pinastri MD-312]|nr:hypothetical protein HYDPIDRAFT_105989 [Hydnomerulius pinastri MD-312]